MPIATIMLHRFSLPLIQPYKLALGTVTVFDTVLCLIRDEDGNEGFGEATILTGYTPETIDDSWRIARGMAERIQGLEPGAAGPIIQAEHATAPFTSSAMMTAVEMLDGHPLLDVSTTTNVPLLAIVNATRKTLSHRKSTPVWPKATPRSRSRSALMPIKIWNGFALSRAISRDAR